jgi:hypothetical protein
LTFRTAIVHVLVVILLACPFICLSGAAAGRHVAPSLQKQPGCSCCSQSTPSKGKNDPGKPSSRQEGGTCLCHGAVMDRHVVMPDANHEIITSIVLDDIHLAPQPLAFGCNFFTDHIACHFPVAESGKEVRALIASFLI